MRCSASRPEDPDCTLTHLVFSMNNRHEDDVK